MNKKLLKRTLSATFAALATAAVGAEQALPTPPQSSFGDTESSICAAVTNWPGLGRHVYFTVATYASPSNNVEVHLGNDKNGDGFLAPEETQSVFGVDCGTWFYRDERDNPGRSLIVEDWHDPDNQLTNQPTNQQTKLIHLRQVSQVANRFDFVKVTTRGRGVTAAEIAAKVTRPGAALILR